jgi:UDP-2,3-diacylglucosamine pyrophosphatase LpxH
MGIRDRRLDEVTIEDIPDLREKKIIILSDIHLGYREEQKNGIQYCNKEIFKEFLEDIKLGNREEFNCDYLIIAGDFLDMWRRDLAGVVLENINIFEKLNELQERGIEVKYIVGNHDYWLRRVDKTKFGYEFTCYKNLMLVDDNLNYFFFHGDVLEYWNILKDATEAAYDGLCLSDDYRGNQMEYAWQIFSYFKEFNLWQRIKNFFSGKKGNLFNHFFDDQKKKLRTAESRFQRISPIQSFSRMEHVEIEAIKIVRDNNIDILVFGHTHRPFHFEDSEKDFIVANTGTWVGETGKVNTYIKIKEGKVTLYQYSSGKGTPITSFSADSNKLM